ncbi:MAG: hypothetical protein KF833_14630 [Verrucomicrobiae bacterium]|nr:hypothetical protein [Verrucomicrobiae bacterium]
MALPALLPVPSRLALAGLLSAASAIAAIPLPPVAPLPPPGTGDFAVSIWIEVPPDGQEAGGDLVTWYDAESRNGLNLSVVHAAAACTSTANTRNLFFGLDAGTEPVWEDCGRPGNNRMVFALATHGGHLYAGTFEHGASESGRVYRHAGGTRWIDCGAPARCNTVSALAVFEGELYAGVSRYSGVGSHLEPSPNPHPGGRVYRYTGGRRWEDCGQPGPGQLIWGMAVHDGRLYVTSLDVPPLHQTTPRQGLYRYEGGARWTWCGQPGGRIAPIASFQGSLFAGGFDGGAQGGLFRYDGDGRWTPFGSPPHVDQTYSMAVHGGRLHTGTWKEGRVFRYLAPGEWEDTGRLGTELEVMGLAHFHGRLYGGTLPLAEVHRLDATGWSLTGRLDFSDTPYRRAWSMAVAGGRLFCGTLPSGHVHALSAGVALSQDRALAPGWRHVAAQRHQGRLELHLDGRRVAISSTPDAASLHLDPGSPPRIGFGEGARFPGRWREATYYPYALSRSHLRALARAAPRAALP